MCARAYNLFDFTTPPPIPLCNRRARWHAQSTSGPELPFGFVQLEPTGNPTIRWDEVAHRISTPNVCLQNVFMAAALDYGDTVGGVHTRYKKPIAARLARAARAVAYNQTDVYYRGKCANVRVYAVFKP